MNNNKQTAVEWLLSQISLKEIGKETFLFPTIKNEFIEQAKAMEKEQIEIAIECGFKDGNLYANGEQWAFESPNDYYNETYGGNK